MKGGGDGEESISYVVKGTAWMLTYGLLVLVVTFSIRKVAEILENMHEIPFCTAVQNFSLFYGVPIFNLKRYSPEKGFES